VAYDNHNGSEMDTQVKICYFQVAEASLMAQAGPTEENQAEIGSRVPRTSATIAALIPCVNEEFTSASMSATFRVDLPDALIYIFKSSSVYPTMECGQESRK
jgi:hypothetical protein